MQEKTYKLLESLLKMKSEELLNYKPSGENETQLILENFILMVKLASNIEENNQHLKKFLQFMAENKHSRIFPDCITTCVSQIQFICCNESKAYNFQVNNKAYCIYGKALNVYKRKIKCKKTGQDHEIRTEIITNIESTLFEMFHKGDLILNKNQSHQIQDILMQYDLHDDSIEPAHLSNQLFSPFIPLPYAIVMVLPTKSFKSEQLIQFLKNTLLHVYLDQALLMNKIMQREVFYKNSTFKGVYFIEEGEVQATSGRIVARGWVTNGKCRSSGYGWKFKILPFFKFISKNQNIWKQFLNDLMLNSQYPFKISYILNLEDQPEIQQYSYRNNKRTGNSSTKFPRIGNLSFDYAKYAQIEKVKHYDDRINEMCEFKKKLLLRKLGGSLTKNIQHTFASDENDKESKRRNLLKKQSMGSKEMLRKGESVHQSSNENILILSVLKRLESLADQNPIEDTTKQIQRRNIKITPMIFYEKAKQQKKKRYNQN